MSPLQAAHLVLADGTVFEGVPVGYRPEDGVATGEVVFNTALSGYQEIVTDPSYAGQVITFTYRSVAASSCATSPGARRTGGRPTTSKASSSVTASRASPASTLAG